MTARGAGDSTAQSPKPESVSHRILLVVEGKEEVALFDALAKHMGLLDIQTTDTGGKLRLATKLELLKQDSGFGQVRAIGVVQDADRDHTGRFRSVCGALRRARLPAPDVELEPAGQTPFVVVLIVPGKGRPGALEDVCLEAIRNEPAMPCVESYFECLKRTGIREPRELSKAKTRVFLASKPKPDLRLGEACKENYWPFDHDAFTDLRTLLDLLSNQDQP